MERESASFGTPRGLTPSRAEADGVPVYTLSVPGPLRAMLIFRVGAVDETLPMRGITHLVEHAAMFPVMQGFSARDRVNARVELLHTRFMAAGSTDEITAFLGEVTSGLSRIPSDRLEAEKKVLRTEAANRQGGSLKGSWSWRFGAAGPGLIDYDEFGLRWLGREHVEHWASTYFTAANAVLWLTGPLPAGLKLNLPPGERRPIPVAAPVPVKTPAIYQQGDRWVVLSMLGPRGAALNAGTYLLNGRLRERLRHQESLSYDVRANYERLDAGKAEVSCFADALAPSATAAATAIAEVARGLAQEGPTAEALAAMHAERRQTREHPDSGIGLLEQVALQDLDGLERKTTEQLEAELEALTPADIAGAMKAALETSILSIPRDVPMTVPGFTPIPAGVGERIKGVQLTAMPGAKHADVIDYSEQGVSLTQPNLTTIGVRWSDVAVAMWWADGRRSLIGRDGAGINIVPERWRHAEQLINALQAYVPQDRWVPMDEAGALPRQAGPVCGVCQSTPAVEVTFQDPRSLFMIWFRRVHGVLCRDCGIAKFREVQRRVLVRGWWSIPGLVVTPVALLANLSSYFTIRRLAPPIHSSGINPLPKGRTVWLYPGMLIPVALLAAAALMFWPR